MGICFQCTRPPNLKRICPRLTRGVPARRQRAFFSVIAWKSDATPIRGEGVGIGDGGQEGRRASAERLGEHRGEGQADRQR